MKKVNEKIVLYLSGNLNKEEQTELGKEIEKSPELKEQLLSLQNRLNELKDIPEDSINEFYFRNLLPRARTRFNKKREKSFIFKLAYTLPVLIVTVIIIFSVNRKSSELNQMIAALPDAYTTSMISELTDENEDIAKEISSDTSTVEIINSNLVPRNELGDKIKSANITFTADELYENLSDEEINDIYNEMLKTKIL